MRAHHHLDAIGPAREVLVDIALPVTDADHLRCDADERAGRGSRIEPAQALLVLDRPLGAGAHRRCVARPDLRMRDADHRLLVEIDGKQRMDEEAERLAVTGRSKAAARAIGAGEVDLGCVLHQQDRAPASRLGRAPGRGRDRRFRRDVFVVEQAMGGKLTGARAADLAHHR